jgi:hypothetical protein
MLGKLANAIARLPAGDPDVWDERQRLDLLAAFNNTLEKVCRELGLDFQAVRAADPKRGASANQDWRNAAHARAYAIYFLNQHIGHKQRHIAEAVGLTPARVCQVVREVEDERDAGAVAELMGRIGLDLIGRAE